MTDFSLQFKSAPFEALDQLALLATQDYNLGSAGDWFGEFRGGLYGFYARLHGVRIHYSEVHAWLPRVRLPNDIEYQLTTILFQMDSALECFTFALNALGWAAHPSGFRDVTDVRTLRQVGPLDILGDPIRIPAVLPIRTGYAEVFPRLQAIWQREAALIARIRELHDVSKHRRTVFLGGKLRSDPPNGFYEALGIAEDDVQRTILSPMAGIILMHDPKAPSAQRTSTPSEQRELLEALVPSFTSVINESATAALEDAQTNVPLNEG